MRVLFTICLAAGAALAATVAAAQDKSGATGSSGLKPGMWEIVSDVQASEGPSKKVTSRLCYAAADVAVVERILPPQRGMGLKCDLSDIRRNASSVRWKLACTGKSGAYAGSGTQELFPTSYTATVRLEPRAGAGKAARYEQSTSARWVSDCR